MSRLLQSVIENITGTDTGGRQGGAGRAPESGETSVLVAVWPAVAAAEVSNMGTASVLHS